VTHTKRIDRNLLCKETSFVCYTSSVLRKSRHMKKKKKLRTVAQIKTQDYRNWRLQNFFTIVIPPVNTATTLFNEPRSWRLVLACPLAKQNVQDLRILVTTAHDPEFPNIRLWILFVWLSRYLDRKTCRR